MQRSDILTISAVAAGCLMLAAAFAAGPLRAADDAEAWKDESVVIEDDPGGTGGIPLPDIVNSGELRRFLQLADNLRKNHHVFGGSYGHVPAPGWRSDRYEGFFRNSFRIGDSYRLGAGLSYSQSNTFRDRDFPGTLYNAGAGLNFSGDRFFVYAGAANRSDRLFSGFDDITVSAAALGTAYRSGPHGLIIGGVFTLRGEIWKYPAPLPVIAYRYASRTLVIFAGLPFFMFWKPNKWFTLTLYGFLPGVGRASFVFKVADWCTITLDYAHTKDSYHLNEYPYHDRRCLEHRADELSGKSDGSKRFILENNETGARFSFRPVDEVMLHAYAGYRFKTIYYFSNNILVRPRDPDRIANSLSVSAGAQFLFHSGGGSDTADVPAEVK